MSGLTPDRAIEIQNHLMHALLGDHSYGGQEAEIYVYLALNRDPGVEAYARNGAAQGEDSVFKQDFEDAYTEAFRDFRRIFVRFEREWKCRVLFRADSREPWKPARDLEGILTTHRFYVTVISFGAGGIDHDQHT